MSEVALYAELDAVDGSEETVAGLLAEYGALVAADEETVAFRAHRRAGEAGRFFVYETYTDAAGFARHLARPACGRFNEAVAPHLRGGASRLTHLEPLSPR